MLDPRNGCASSGNNYNDSHVGEIKEGVTTEAQLIQWFGEPQQRTVQAGRGGIAPGAPQASSAAVGDTSKRTVLTWTYAEASVNGKSFIPFAGAFVGGQNTNHKSLSVVLKDGVVESYSSSSGGMDTRGHTQSTPTN